MSKEIEQAMNVLKQAMINDEPSVIGSYAHTWHCNIAMMCYDAIAMMSEKNDEPFNTDDAHAIGNDAASRFMKLCFDVETKQE